MRSLRYVPGLRRWKKEKIQMVLILLVISVCFFLMTVLTVLLSSYEKTMEEGRYDSFGEWQYCVVNSYTMEEKLIRDIPYFQSIGAIATYGKIQEGDKETDYLVGTIDDEGRSLSRLRLLEGYWPEKDGEFAAEATWLKMNCPGAQIGDHIKITLRPYPYFSFQTPKKRSYQERDCLELSLVLSGILQDYSYAWSISDCVNLPSVIITEQTATMYDLSIRNGMYDDVGAYLLLLQGDEEWDIDEMEVDLSQLPFHKRSGVLTELLRNDYAYPVLSDDFQLVQKIFAALKIAVIVFGICILSIVLGYSVKNRREEMRQLFLLGQTISKMRWLLLQECLCFGLSGAILGIITSLAAYAIGIGFIHNHFAFYLEWDMVQLLLSWVSGALAIAIPYGFLIMKARSLAIEKEQAIKRRRRRKRVKKQVLWKTIWYRAIADNILLVMLRCIIICVLLVTLCTGIRNVYVKFKTVNITQKNTRSAYILYGNNDSMNVSRQGAEELRGSYGVRKVEAYHKVEGEAYDYYIDLSVIPDGHYKELMISMEAERVNGILDSWNEMGDLAGAEKQAALAEQEYLTDQRYPMKLTTTTDEDEWKRYLEEVDEGEPELENILSGNEVVLVLPTILEYNDGYSAYEMIEGRWDAKRKDISVYQPEKILKGDTYLTITCGTATQKVKIGGVIYGFSSQNSFLPLPGNNMTILGSDEFLMRFAELPKDLQDAYQEVVVLPDYSADTITDQQIVRIAKNDGVEFENNRADVQSKREELVLAIIFYGTICGLGLILGCVILYNVTYSYCLYIAEQNQILKCLGMKKRWELGMKLLDAIIPCIASIMICYIGISWYLTEERRKLFEDFGEPVNFQWGVGFPRKWYYGISLVYLLIMTGHYLWTTRNKGMEDR